MPSRPPRFALALVLSSGCMTLEVATSPSRSSFSAAAEDGSRYVSAEGGAMSSPRAVERRWRAAAQDACEGDYIVLSDAAFERRSLGVVQQRVHEGYVSCVAPVE